jgi:hypothetical protein
MLFNEEHLELEFGIWNLVLSELTGIDMELAPTL